MIRNLEKGCCAAELRIELIISVFCKYYKLLIENGVIEGFSC